MLRLDAEAPHRVRDQWYEHQFHISVCGHCPRCAHLLGRLRGDASAVADQTQSAAGDAVRSMHVEIVEFSRSAARAGRSSREVARCPRAFIPSSSYLLVGRRADPARAGFMSIPSLFPTDANLPRRPIATCFGFENKFQVHERLFSLPRYCKAGIPA